MTGAPLDLRAIERQHVPGNGKGIVAQLLAALRAHRAVLQRAPVVPGYSWDGERQRILAAVVDAPALRVGDQETP